MLPPNPSPEVIMFVPCRSRQFLRLLYIGLSIVFLISILHNLTHNYKSVPQFLTRDVDPVVTNTSLLKELESSTKLYQVLPSANATESEEEDDEWELDNENIPDLPVILGKKQNGPKQFGPNCAKFPDLYTVQFSNVHWQIQETSKEIYFLYSAYLDMRGQKSESEAELLSKSKVRILAMTDAKDINASNSSLKACQFWFPDKSKPVFGNITECRLVWNIKWGRTGHYYPYLITCQLPEGLTEVPVSVSVVSENCTHATNNLNIMHKELANQSLEARTPQKNFAVCVKALDFPDAKMSSRLIEWIEMLRILGADKIFFYEYFVDSEVKKLLDFYEKQGVIDVAQTTLPGELPNQPQLRHLFIRGKRLDKRLTELIPYNDCLYKNLYEYKYILVIDTDELIIPTEDITWSDLLEIINTVDIGDKSIEKERRATYCFRNFYFLDGMLKENDVTSIPSSFHMLRHIYRSRESTGSRYMKCFHSTEFTAGVHNHFPFFCKDNKQCKRHYVDEKRAQMNHYRETCVGDIKNCSVYLLDTEKDDKLWRYKDELMNRVETVLSHIT